MKEKDEDSFEEDDFDFDQFIKDGGVDFNN